MTFSNGGGQGQHFRGRYSPAKPPPATAPVEAEAHGVPTIPAEQPTSREQPKEEKQLIAQAQPRPASIAAQRNESLSSPLPSPPKNALIAGVVVAGVVAILAALISNRQPPQALLSWQSSCGSPPVSGSSWWPVLGPADALETVRRRYCGDAYLTAEGASQVASFSSFEEATAFAQRLADASGYSFRVGQPRTP